MKRHNAGRFPFFVPALVFHAWAIDGLLGLAWAASKGRQGLSALCLVGKRRCGVGVLTLCRFFGYFWVFLKQPTIGFFRVLVVDARMTFER